METVNGVDVVLAVWAVAATVTAFGYRRAWLDATEPPADVPLDDLLGGQLYDHERDGL